MMNPLLLIAGAILVFLGLTQENEEPTTDKPVQSGKPARKPKAKKPKASRPAASEESEQSSSSNPNSDSGESGESGDPLLDQIQDEPNAG